MIENYHWVLRNIIDDLNLITEEQADRALNQITEVRSLHMARVGVEIEGRTYVISVEDVSS